MEFWGFFNFFITHGKCDGYETKFFKQWLFFYVQLDNFKLPLIQTGSTMELLKIPKKKIRIRCNDFNNPWSLL